MGAAGVIAGIGVATSLVGTGLGIAAANKEADDRERAAREDKMLKGLQADEILSRAESNKRELDRQLTKYRGASLARGGGQRSILALEDATQQVLREKFNMDREAQHRAMILRMGGDLSMAEAADFRRGTTLTNIGTGVRGIGTAADRALPFFDSPKPAEGLTGAS
jgi:hypothetical protein